MRHRVRPFSRFGVLIAILAPLVVSAQDDKIALRPAPVPNQTIHVTMTQIIDMDMTRANMGGAPMKVAGKTVFEGTNTVGAADDQGRLTAQFVYDKISADMTMNGQPILSGNTFAALQGQVMTIVYDAQGNVVDVKVPESLAATGVDFKEMTTSMFGRIPNATLGVGESTTIPINLPLPIPMGGQRMNMTGQAVYKLKSIARDGDSRVANLDHTIQARMKTEGGDGPAIDFQMNGVGTSQWHVDRRIMKTSEQKMTLEGTMTGGAMNMSLNGTMQMTLEAK